MTQTMTEAATPTATGTALLEDAAVLERFAPGEADAIGLIAYALHQRARISFHAEFSARQGRLPSPAEEEVFLIGEVSEARIKAYRASAEAMIGQKASILISSAPKRKPRWPWFGVWVDAPMAPSGEPEKINWRGLFLRLLTLFLAVVATAILLRVLVVKS